MIEIRRSGERGHADHGWLDTYHTFSFAGYHDPDFMGFEHLRVLNQDRVAPGRGFGTHGHRDMEIVSYVLDGVLEHEDSLGNGSQMRPGDVQLMSAGSGVTHSEYNGSSEEALHFLQMWIEPRTTGTAPRYEQRHFPIEERRGRLRQVVSPDGAEGSLTIDQDARLLVGSFRLGDRYTQILAPRRGVWVHVARGSVEMSGETLGPGDGAGVRNAMLVELVGIDDAEVVLWDLPVT